MTSIISDLEDVERQLGPQQPTPGRGVFYSIQSALASIRARLEGHTTSMTESEQQPLNEGSNSTTVAMVASNSDDDAPISCVGRLMERLRLAELAHSACIPLDRLYTELSRRQQETTEVPTSNRALPVRPAMQPHDVETGRSSPLSSSSRRSSFLSASRRRVDKSEISLADQTLYGSSLSLSRQSSLGESGEGIEMVIDEVSNMGSSKTTSMTPTILLTEKSRSSLDLARQSVLFPDFSLDDMDVDALVPPSSTTVYSWGTGTNSLHDHCHSVSLHDARVLSDSPVGRADVVAISMGEHHSACLTATGQLLISGRNTSGEVDPDRKEQLITKPVLLESLNHARIVQVSCGFNHTAALNSHGVVLTWGSNEFGQLGHQEAIPLHKSTTNALFCRPAMMALGLGHRATLVACGDGFTLCLTSRMGILACGVESISGIGPDEVHHLPRAIPALKYLPLVGIAAGRGHAVALTAHGTAFAWGDNTYGTCGRDHPKTLHVPMPIKPFSDTDTLVLVTHLRPPLTHWTHGDNKSSQHVFIPDDWAIARASCGSDTTVLVTRSGKLLVCGRNNHGQLGHHPGQNEVVHSPQLVVHPTVSRRFVHAEAGDVHTLLLDSMGDVWQMGGVNQGSLGCTQVLSGKGVRSIGAGGEHNVAVAIRPGRCLPRREFSDATMKNDQVQLADCVEDLIRSLPGELQPSGVAVGSGSCDTLTTISERAEELFRTPAVLNSLFMDPTELEELYTKLLNIKSMHSRQKVVSAIERGMRKGLDVLRTDDSRLMWPEQVRFLLLYIQSPMFVHWKQEGSMFDRRGDLILSLCESVLGMPYEGYVALMAWATSVYSKDQFVRLLVQPLLSQLKKGLSVDAGAERRPIPLIVALLKWLHNASERVGNMAMPDDFYSDAISNMHPTLLYKDLERYKHASKHQRAADFFFCNNPFLISPCTKRNLLQMENEILMLKAAASTGITYNPQEHSLEFNAFYVLEIEREHLLKQTFEAISKADPVDLRKKLRVVFKGEDGVDAGGVTREFFQLLSGQLFDVTTGMWSSRYNDANTTWFSSDCSWNDVGFQLCGVLVALAVYNSVLLDVHFPQAVYRKLLSFPLGLEDLPDADIRRSLQQLLDYSGDDIQDVFSLTFDVHWVDLGQEKRKELKPNGSNIPVTSENKEEYVMLYVKWLLVDSVYPQYESFEAGFMRVMENTTLDLLRPEELELLVVGTPSLDFDALQTNTEYEGGYDANSAAVVNFWRFVKNAAPETQLNLLKFTTGSTRAPIGGLGKLAFKLQRAGPDSDNLPTSHTCFNTLLLPDYGNDYAKLSERLGRAILECEGFGLQ